MKKFIGGVVGYIAKIAISLVALIIMALVYVNYIAGLI